MIKYQPRRKDVMSRIGMALIAGWVVLCASVLAAAIVGWVLNIVWVFSNPVNDSAEWVMHVLGLIIPPLGAVMGWL